MENKLSMEDICGADKVLMDDGRIVKVYDVHPLYIQGTDGIWYEIKKIKKIVERFRK